MDNQIGIRMQNSAGLVTTTAANDTVHTTSIGRTARLRKILAYNNTGANATIRFGTLDAQAVPVFVPLLPTLLLINTFDRSITEDELPLIVWQFNQSAGALGRSGNIIVVASIAGVLISCEIEEN